MQYMLVYRQPGEEFNKAADPAQAANYFGAWKAYMGAMAQAGIMVNGHGLQPPQSGTIVQIRNGKRHIQDGPFADTKEHLGGYVVIDVPALDDALEWAARAPSTSIGSTEVRPVLPAPPAA